MAPEQIREDEVSASCDVFSLGVVLYELLVSRPPFIGPGIHETIDRILHRRQTPPEEIRPDLPQPLLQIVARALQKHPLKRYQSALDLSADLDLVEDDLVRGAGGYDAVSELDGSV
jgi:serine/threonine-protein kinase